MSIPTNLTASMYTFLNIKLPLFFKSKTTTYEKKILTIKYTSQRTTNRSL